MLLMLTQISGLSPAVAALIRLSDGFPTQLAYWLFAAHWLYWAGLILIAGAVIWRGLIAHELKIRNVGLAILLVTLMWMLVAWSIITPQERLILANEQIVRAAAQHNVSGIMAYIAPTAMFGDLSQPQIRQLLSQRIGEADISSNYIRRLHVAMDGRYATVLLTVLSIARSFGGPMITYWRLDWSDQKSPGNWEITHIRLLKVNNHALPPDATIPDR